MKKLPSLAALGCIGLATACGGSAEEPQPDSPVSIAVAETAGIPSAFLEYGVREGYFEEEGLDVSVDTSTGGAAAVPALVSGDIQFAGSNTVSALLAIGQGLPVSIVAPGTFGSETPEEDFSAVLVSSDSEVTRAADLEGATVAVNTLENIGDLTISEVIDSDGGDSSTVEFVEIGFPDMLPALERGQIDAAWLIEPFVTMGMNDGNTPVLWPYVDSYPSLMVGSFLTTDQYAEENSEVVQAFQDAVATTAAAVADNESEFREALPELSQVSEEAAEAMVLPEWRADVDLEALGFIEERMRERGSLGEPIDVSEIVVE